MTKFSGTIEKLYVKYVDKVKKYSVSIVNSNNFYGLGLHNDKFVKVGDVVLKEGMQVEFEYAGQFKNIDMNTFKIIQQEVPKEVKKAKNDKDLAIRLGNSITIATHLTKSKLDIVAIAKQVMPMVDELRDKLATKHTTMDTYSLGARLGQAAIIAAQYTASIDDFIGFAEELFEEICQAEEDLKNPKKVKKEETNSVQNNLTQSQHNVATPVYNEPSVYWDNDIPFAPIGLQYPQLLWSM
ncbi:hypothetical protein [Aeromonas phage 4L372D]|uniref:Uncharacterized protein n=2 Tax=Plateaulakevirus TaxID=2843436 RepID=A0A5B9N967_9CAUD|nr:hypothetical protein HWC25_gp072 [Aeromonas phage 2L372D]YP_009846644.1 hypothetical protein HWC27_gp096 [Aeromonas phage 4L372D]QDB73986.1 hypothetical protein 2L372D_072 [Aeromonas phage 2L372D]QEG08560.1 hypothetical protein [Aeromonas phage 4L372D]